MTRLHFLLCVMCFQWSVMKLVKWFGGCCGSESVKVWFEFLPGLQQQGIFRVPGSQVEVNDIKNSFERGESEQHAFAFRVKSRNRKEKRGSGAAFGSTISIL